MKTYNKYQILLSKINKKNNFKITIDKDSYNGKKIIEIIINATRLFCGKKKIYLEIGVFRGNTLINNAINNQNTQCYGVDNFSLFNKKKNNKKIVKEKIRKFNLKNIKLINSDFEKAINRIDKQIGVLFIDGPHDYRSQLIALMKYEKFLAKNCVIIIDDANYFHVRKATKDFLDINKKYFLLFQKYTPKHIANSVNKDYFINGYWNGINIISKYKTTIKLKFQKNKDFLMKMFLQSHEIFRHKYIFNCLEILNLTYDFKNDKITDKIFIKKIKNIKIPKKIKKVALFKSQNIF